LVEIIKTANHLRLNRLPT